MLKTRSPLPVLLAACALCAASFGALLAAPDFASAAALAVVAGAFIAPLHPLAKAQAYRAMPGRSSFVNAVGAAVGVLDCLMPVALGVVVDRCGVTAALACLLVQPVGVGALTLLALFRRQGDVDTARATSSSDGTAPSPSAADGDPPSR